MGLFSKKQRWTETFRLEGRIGTGRGFLTVFFWFWGAGGLILLGASLGGLTGSIGVGTSAYLSAMCLFWIGGMVLFGLGALLARNDFSAVKPAEDYDAGDVRLTR
jgi:hypothetical protein